MFDSFWFIWGVPLGALAFASIGYLWLRYEGKRLDREQ